MKKLLSAAGSLLLVLVMIQGCSDKKEKTPLPAAQQEVPAELPVLEQNLIYQTNRPPDPEPDYSFTPVDNEIEEAPSDEERAPLLD